MVIWQASCCFMGVDSAGVALFYLFTPSVPQEYGLFDLIAIMARRLLPISNRRFSIVRRGSEAE